MAFSSDFIVGYPGETDKDFQESLEVIEKVRFASSYSFKYSPRPGTPSSLKDSSIDCDVVDMRLKEMQSILNKHQTEFNLSFIDKTVDVLFSGKGKKPNQYVGRTPHLQPVHVLSSKNLSRETFERETRRSYVLLVSRKIICIEKQLTKELNKNLNIFSKTISFSDNSILPIVFGEHDKFLKIIENKLLVSIFPRGNFLKVSGEVNKVKITCNLLQTLFENVKKNHFLDEGEVHGMINLLKILKVVH